MKGAVAVMRQVPRRPSWRCSSSGWWVARMAPPTVLFRDRRWLRRGMIDAPDTVRWITLPPLGHPSMHLLPSPLLPPLDCLLAAWITALTRHKDREHPPRAHNEGVSAPVHQFKISLGPGPPVISGGFLGLCVFTPPHAYTSPLITSPTSYIPFIYFPPFKIRSSPS